MKLTTRGSQENHCESKHLSPGRSNNTKYVSDGMHLNGLTVATNKNVNKVPTVSKRRLTDCLTAYSFHELNPLRDGDFLSAFSADRDIIEAERMNGVIILNKYLSQKDLSRAEHSGENNSMLKFCIAELRTYWIENSYRE
jgi:hypothetical protein